MAAGKPKRKQKKKKKKGEGKSVRSTVTKGFWLTQQSRGTQQECFGVVVGRSHHKQNGGLCNPVRQKSGGCRTALGSPATQKYHCRPSNKKSPATHRTEGAVAQLDKVVAVAQQKGVQRLTKTTVTRLTRESSDSQTPNDPLRDNIT